MRVVIFILMCFTFMPVQAFAIGTNTGNAAYTTAIFKNFDKQNSQISNAVYKHSTNEYTGVTDDPKVMTALDMMIGTLGEKSREGILGNNPTGKPMRIQFKNLSSISPAYADFDALGWSEDNQLNIYINSKHKNAPAEAICSLLSHEGLHQDESNSYNEETYAWTIESAVWLQMKKRNPQLDKNSNICPLVYRENTLGNMFKNAKYTDKLIREEVESNPGYTDLPKQSPGFLDNN